MKIEEPTNDDRAGWADDALQGFADATRIDEIDDERQFVAASDLMAGIMHLFASRALDFYAALRRAEIHWMEERDPSPVEKAKAKLEACRWDLGCLTAEERAILKACP